MPTGDWEAGAVTLSHQALFDAITRSANLFHSLGISPDSGTIAFLCPALGQAAIGRTGVEVGDSWVTCHP
jgi:hypothetical protein